MNIEQRVDLLEFQLQLLFTNSDLDRFLYEMKITRQEHHALADYMDKVEAQIYDGVPMSKHVFEAGLYEAVPRLYGDYHFCEIYTRLCMEEGKWEKVHSAIYQNSN